MAERRFPGVGDPRRLRLLLAFLFFGLAIPAVLLVRQAFNQLELDAFRQQQIAAESLVQRIDGELVAAFRVEDARTYEDFTFTGTGADNAASADRRSPLARLPVASPVPGALGHFQIDAAGSLTTPLLPSGSTGSTVYGLSDEELRERGAAATRLLDILAENRLVRGRDSADATGDTGVAGAGRREGPLPAAADEERRAERSRAEPPASAEPFVREAVVVDSAESGLAHAPAIAADSPSAAEEGDRAQEEQETRGQAAFDQLAIRRLSSAAPDTAPTLVQTAAQGNAPGTAEASQEEFVQVRAATLTELLDARVDTFQSELEPLVFSSLDTDHFVLFRNAWRDGERFVQGLLIDGETFVDEVLAAPLAAAGLAQSVRLTAATGSGRTIDVSAGGSSVGDRSVQTDALFAARLSPPFADIELRFVAGDLEPAAGVGLLTWTTIVLFLVLTGGILAMYRFGMKQIELARQQQNFVSAVSHELKTPLTSIRMYGEMLKSGWASDEKKQTYYDFIYAEGERLSRLIDNVLTLARLNRSSRSISPEDVTVPETIDLVRSKVSSQAEQAGFMLSFETDESIDEVTFRVDPDAISQIFINLVDNALKFAASATRREIVISGRVQSDVVILAIRDFGPGIPAADMRRLFELFYRPDNELTRTTTGTGIGLALVRELMSAMDGKVDVRNVDPGAEFRLLFPVAQDSG